MTPYKVKTTVEAKVITGGQPLSERFLVEDVSIIAGQAGVDGLHVDNDGNIYRLTGGGTTPAPDERKS